MVVVKSLGFGIYICDLPSLASAVLSSLEVEQHPQHSAVIQSSHQDSSPVTGLIMSHEHTQGEHHSNWVAANQEYFDAEVKAADANPEYIKMGEQVVETLVEIYPALFDKQKTTVLDFACGSGKFF